MSRLICKLTLAAFCLLGAGPVCFLVAQQGAETAAALRAQDKKPSGLKLVEVWTPNRADPVSILDIRVGNEQVKPADYNGEGRPLGGAPFQSDENWLANLSFTLRNRTSKTITHLYVPIGFLETETKDAGMVSKN